MSMISEQLFKIRFYADEYKNLLKCTSDNTFLKIFRETCNILNNAADTIESLSAKLQASNAERSDVDCCGWIECESGKLPDKEVICCDVCGEIIIGYIHETYESEQTGFSAENTHEYMYNCVKWMEKPTP